MNHPIDELKIDKSFIAAMDTSAQASVLVSTLIQLASSIGIDAEAEGVEDAGQTSRLREEQCRLVQGFDFSRRLADLEMYLRFDDDHVLSLFHRLPNHEQERFIFHYC